MVKFFLDPGSRPALRDLAGMTNFDTFSGGVREHVVAVRN